MRPPESAWLRPDWADVTAFMTTLGPNYGRKAAPADAVAVARADLAERLGVSRQAVNAVETEKHDPSLDLAFRISTLFQRPVEARAQVRIAWFRPGIDRLPQIQGRGVGPLFHNSPVRWIAQSNVAISMLQTVRPCTTAS